MTSLHSIIKTAQAAQGSKEKTAILMANKDHELLAAFLKATNDPTISYYIAEAPEPTKSGTMTFDLAVIDSIVDQLGNRKITGNAARAWLGKIIDLLAPEGQELLSLMIKRQIGGGIGDSMSLKVYPNLYFIPPYSRCSLMSPEARKTFDKEEWFYCQTKMDGQYSSFLVGETVTVAYTRQGNTYPQWIVDRISAGLVAGYAYMGELLVYLDGEMLSRKTGNGVLNSILAGEIETEEMMKYDFTLTAWNAVTLEEFKASESKRDYEARFVQLVGLIATAERVKLVDSYVVSSLEDAYAIYSEHLLAGKEGCIIKRRTGKWKDNTSKDDIKLKMKFEIDMEVTGFYEGTGKYVGMLGGLNLRSADGKVISNVGSGFTDKEREELFKIGNTLIGRIAAIEINDVVSKEGQETLSLNLPIYIEFRTFEKTVADTLERIIEIREAAKSGTKLK